MSVRPPPLDCDRALILGIKPWKRWQIDRFLAPRFASLAYFSTPGAALREQSRGGGTLVVWASRETPELDAAARTQGARLLRMEDGFLRSTGLGSTHVGGASLVVDDLGIYFDPSRPSRLESMLQDDAFDEALIARAARLRRLLVEFGLTKYNVGRTDTAAIGGAHGQARILVPGQVEDDASVRRGSPRIRSNLDLLRAVREECPQAWIVYKPHPDTEAGTRPGRVDSSTLRGLADQVVANGSIATLLPQVHAVHTMTSLAGFEALLRGVAVVTWGQPFYAGWGLTSDRHAPPGRTRSRTLDELVAATLIRYPIYVDPHNGAPCEPEDLARILAGQRISRGVAPDASVIRRIARLCRGWLRSQLSRPSRG